MSRSTFETSGWARVTTMREDRRTPLSGLRHATGATE